MSDPRRRKFILYAGVTILVIVAFWLGYSLDDQPRVHTAGDHAAATTWTCSMHPQIKLPEAGQCPLCFMDLIPLDNDGDEALPPRTLVLSESAAALAEIQTSRVQRGRAFADIRLTGRVAYDETRLSDITTRVSGRIDTLFVDFTGTSVEPGQPLASLYSPELYAAQTELLGALQAGENSTVAKSARERLRLWGLSSMQIKAIETRGTAASHLHITSPTGGVVIHKTATEGLYVQTGTEIYKVADLSRVWVNLDAYESDLALLAAGQTVDFSVNALPGLSFSGEIQFIDPVLEPQTRTARVRVEVDNAQGKLKPGMFVKATAAAAVDTDSEILPLLIPATAPLITGERAVVYVRHPAAEKPTFTGRDVVLGSRVGASYIVVSGLQEDERVVTRGNFKIDSALQIKAEHSMMNPPEVLIVHDAPQAFHTQLGAVLQAYLELQTALAADDDAPADDAAARMVEKLNAVDMTLLSGDAHIDWMEQEKLLRARFMKLAQAADIKARRDQFLHLSDPLWETLRLFAYTRDEPLRLFNCPMADLGKGGDWIQLESTTANPYFGAAMLRCGSQIDSLTADVTP
jgi:membrane fusion protein, copper/silver efflux system